MRDKKAQNGSNKKPSEGVYDKIKVSLFANKLVNLKSATYRV